jgi:hypothetical protein
LIEIQKMLPTKLLGILVMMLLVDQKCPRTDLQSVFRVLLAKSGPLPSNGLIAYPLSVYACSVFDKVRVFADKRSEMKDIDAHVMVDFWRLKF